MVCFSDCQTRLKAKKRLTTGRVFNRFLVIYQASMLKPASLQLRC